MSSLGDINIFTKGWTKDILSKIKKNPERLFIGAIDELGSKAWGKVLGKDYGGMVDAMGAPTSDQYRDQEAQGVNIRPARRSHNVARVVALASMAGGAMGGGQGGGGSPSGGAGDGGGWMNNMPSMPSMGGDQQQEEEPVVKPLEVDYDQSGAPVIVSSKAKKTPGVSASMADLMKRGLSGDNVIDALGVRTGLIKEAGTELDQIEAQLDKLLSGAKQ